MKKNTFFIIVGVILTFLVALGVYLVTSSSFFMGDRSSPCFDVNSLQLTFMTHQVGDITDTAMEVISDLGSYPRLSSARQKNPRSHSVGTKDMEFVFTYFPQKGKVEAIVHQPSHGSSRDALLYTERQLITELARRVNISVDAPPLVQVPLMYAINCSQCTTRNPDDARYCKQCGTQVVPLFQEDFPNTPALELGKVTANSIGMKLAPIEAGQFWLGCSGSEKGLYDHESPQHLVQLTEGFLMGITEVTQHQWTEIMGSRPWSGKRYVKEGDDYPAVCVSWNDAVAFCEKLSQKERRTYRLPTEAEWEYACRAGTMTVFSFGSYESRIHGYAWFYNTMAAGEEYAHPVAQKERNPWGLHDMHGNVYEWCSDWYDEKAYSSGQAINPQGALNGTLRVSRGGAWDTPSIECRSANRYYSVPDSRSNDLGFRVVVDLEGEK